MNILLVDDELLNLDNLEYIVSTILPDSERSAFSKASKAMEFIETHPVDIAFLDIEMRGTDGITIARALRERNPRTNILFCTGYSQYALDAWNLDCSGYLLKPITEAKVRHALENLRYPIESHKRIRFRCFGNFEAYCDETPISFKYNRTKELLAYLVDRNGAACNIKELSSVLFEDDLHRSYLYQLRNDLINTLEELGASDILLQDWGAIGICREKVSCDYYDYLDGSYTPMVQEYMTQYSFGEATLAALFPIQ